MVVPLKLQPRDYIALPPASFHFLYGVKRGRGDDNVDDPVSPTSRKEEKPPGHRMELRGQVSGARPTSPGSTSPDVFNFCFFWVTTLKTRDCFLDYFRFMENSLSLSVFLTYVTDACDKHVFFWKGVCVCVCVSRGGGFWSQSSRSFVSTVPFSLLPPTPLLTHTPLGPCNDIPLQVRLHSHTQLRGGFPGLCVPPLPYTLTTTSFSFPLSFYEGVFLPRHFRHLPTTLFSDFSCFLLHDSGAERFDLFGFSHQLRNHQS